MKKQLLSCLLVAVFLVASACAEGLLPTLDDVYGVPMPSLYDTLKKLPDEQNDLDDGSIEEIWRDVSDEDYDNFGQYLMRADCQMDDYRIENGVFTALVLCKGQSFSFIYNSSSREACLIYPKGTYDEALNHINQLYNDAVEAYEAGNKWIALEKLSRVDLDYKDTARYRSSIVSSMMSLIAAGTLHTVGVKADGTVVATGNNEDDQCKVKDWTSIIAISSSHYHTVGLKSDGTVVATGKNTGGCCDVVGWTDIKAISAGWEHTLGLTADNTVVAAGCDAILVRDQGQCNVNNWTDVIDIAAGAYHSIGLKTDHTVVATGWNDDQQCNVSGWSDIIAIAAAGNHTVGLKTDGTVVAVGYNKYGQCDVQDWTDIIAVSAGSVCTVGLKRDGTVVATGSLSSGDCNVASWKDIVAVSANWNHIVGLKADGTVVAIGTNDDGQCNVKDWDLMH